MKTVSKFSTIGSLIDKFEIKSKSSPIPITKNRLKATEKRNIFRKSKTTGKQQINQSNSTSSRQMVESDEPNADETTAEIDSTENNDLDQSLEIYTEIDDENIEKTRPKLLCNQFNNFIQCAAILLTMPFFSAINRIGVIMIPSVFFLPRIVTQTVLYPVFRLIFGTLYPAYASYKAVRNKEVKDYVRLNASYFAFLMILCIFSINLIVFIVIFYAI